MKNSGYMIFACMSVFITCIELHQATNETGNSDVLQDDSLLNSSLDVNVVELELTTQFNEEQNISIYESPLDVSSHLPTTTSSSAAADFLGVLSSKCGLLPNTSRTITFHDFVTGLNDSSSRGLLREEESKQQSSHGIKKITCAPRNISDVDGIPSVKIVNSSELLQHLGSRNSTSGQCTVVLFYAPWCLFSARLAPHYNALARAFPKLDVVAIDAFHFSNLNSRFGTIAVPNIMIFHSAKAIARFNGSERTLSSLTYFVSNVTGVPGNTSVELLEEDYIGPLSSEPSQETDYLLLLSWIFVILCCVVGGVRSSVGLRVWNTLVAMGHHEQHHHQHID